MSPERRESIQKGPERHAKEDAPWVPPQLAKPRLCEVATAMVALTVAIAWLAVTLTGAIA
eukprot:CAMPEP_0118871266 /NCGR_PEP_ID=MMETSP1163-20130328/13916_1 /TAXON_ID=124430 /ORGANISM="Phaeomonas parva, Strain CCMP2877" /LENGTH=59 /DNA_ID=CAMNT_0006806355 /DNA_START=304 /DNA_END=483 /DNA_ORIENTATION=+